MYLYVVTKIFTWFIGWNGMRLRMNEERMVEGAIQLALYAFILFLYWLIQMIALIILLTFIANANPQSPNSNGPTDLAMIELNNFVRCKFNDCCYAKKDKDLWQEENALYQKLHAERNKVNDLSPSPSSEDGSSSTSYSNSSASNRRALLSSNSTNTSSNASLQIFEIDFSPEICFKNAREYPAVLGGSQFCGLGHFCEVVLFVNMSNVTNVTAPSPSSIQQIAGRRMLLSSSKHFNKRYRRHLLAVSSNTTNTTNTTNETATTTATTSTTTTAAPNNNNDPQLSPSPSAGAPAPSPSSVELEPLFIRAKPVYPGDPICDDIFKDIVTDDICSDFNRWYQEFMDEFEKKLMWIIYLVLGIACFEMLGIINAIAANCWFCGPPVKIDIDEEYTDSESSSDEEDEFGVMHHHHGHHRGEKKHASSPPKVKRKKKRTFHRVGMI